MFVEHKGSLEDTLIEMEQDLQSSISYAGGTKLDAIRTVDYVVVKTRFSMVTKYINLINLKDKYFHACPSFCI